MEFYGRETEIKQIRAWEKQSHESAQMTVVMGRRRIGKTSLIRQSLGSSSIYFFVTKKNENFLCDEYVGIIKEKLKADIPGELKTFQDVFKYLLLEAQHRHISLVIDEFQEFYYINSAVYSEMQNLWDTYKGKSKLHLILCGSVYSMMKKIFEDSREPLFQRASHRIHLKPFSVAVQRTILSDHYSKYSGEDLLAFYIAGGGVPRYLELLVGEKAFTQKKIFDALLMENSFFLDEGKNLLVEEFGRDYTTYFSILSLIASSKTSRPDIEGTLGQSVGPYLDRLEKEFSLVRRVTPLFSKPGSRQIRYAIDDNFLNFWFRFIYKYRSAVEISNLAYVRDILERDYRSYAGHMLEKYFREKLILSGDYSAIGTYWERGNANEIDIIAVNEGKRRMLLGEVKLNPKEFRLGELEAKAVNLRGKFQDYRVELAGFSIRDI
ncbi:ATP-binding protein [Leadbettera azotonutricia]|uniref:Dexx-box atpase n=1 Tax=Leadbettera azotonutricia (strain ATCC BAA-888 / DSM 13862 / ZAS-9) TaxID=545695 RepID=F5YAG1_LEAAZ|nr:ATP-binding protein [Leadbettera azotonutricia]AEF82247.1 dexx-box atpase [Leadbettera azotonutricia ZAS-9]